MLRTSCVIVLGCAVMTGLIAVTPLAAQECVLFEDDFESGSLDPWTLLHGKWSVHDWGGEYGKVLRGEGEGKPKCDVKCYQSGFAYVTEGKGWMNYVFEYDIRITDQWDFTSVFRVSKPKKGFYVLNMIEYRDRTDLSDFCPQERVLSEDYPIEIDTWYHVKVTVEGRHITVEVDGDPVFDVVVDDPIEHPGTVGFIIWPDFRERCRGRVIFYDNVKVTSLGGRCESINNLGAKCKTRRVTATARTNLCEGTELSLTLSDVITRTCRVKGNGKCKVAWKGVTTERDHIVRIDDCDRFKRIVRCDDR
ncbi:MAG: family 16 glycoside hydrolase [Phycisphaerae bacterium]